MGRLRLNLNKNRQIKHVGSDDNVKKDEPNSVGFTRQHFDGFAEKKKERKEKGKKRKRKKTFLFQVVVKVRVHSHGRFHPDSTALFRKHSLKTWLLFSLNYVVLLS